MRRGRRTSAGDGLSPRPALELARCFRTSAKGRRGRGDGWRHLLEALGRPARSGRFSLDLPAWAGPSRK
jgi:hypothetical protein